jgi:hypothetical protein
VFRLKSGSPYSRRSGFFAPDFARFDACPGRDAAFFTLLRRTGTVTNTAFRYGPGLAAHHAAKGGAPRSIRGTKPRRLALNNAGFSERLRPQQDPRPMPSQPFPVRRQIYWPSVITVISAAILIGAEVFGAAFAGGWALAILFGLDDLGAHILQAVLFALGVVIMAAFIRAAQRVEPFTRRA